MGGTRKNVFVVHGRNIALKRAMFTFLRSLELVPLEWDQARQLTGKASPTTLEIVRCGIDNAQAVVVILSGDNNVKLRSELGDGPKMVQPRANVIFEAGWALRSAGQERTILVVFDQPGGISDIDGLNYLALTNAPESRKALVERLKTAGCEVIDSGGDHLTISGGGDFESLQCEDHEFDRSEFLDRGRFTEFVVDSSLSLTPSPIKLSKEFSGQIHQTGQIDLKYHYLGSLCATNWLNLCQHPEYGHTNLRNFISVASREFVNPIAEQMRATGLPLDIVSLGPGDGSIDADIIYNFARHGAKTNYYYCIDISFELLQHAVATLSQKQWLDRNIKIKAIYGDFTELSKLSPIYSFDKSIKLFLLTGYTLGNFNEGNLLNGIREGMRPDDFLLLDARLHDLEIRDGSPFLGEIEKQRVVQIHAHRLNDSFAMGPLFANAAFSKTPRIEYEVSTRLTVVPGALNVIFSCRDLEVKIHGSDNVVRKPHLDVAATSMYSFEELAKWFSRKDFRVVWSEKSSQTGLFILQRKS